MSAAHKDNHPIDYPDPLDVLLRDPHPFNSPADRQIDSAASPGHLSSPPTAFDRDLAVMVFVVLFGLTPILFVYAIIKLFE